MIPKKVFVFGGTHGNEWTGAYLVKKCDVYLKEKFPNLDLEFILGNPRGFQENKRFIEEDLNRAFQFLNTNRKSYELDLAREISSKIKKEPCLILDLHTTTSNLGVTLIVTEVNDFNLRLCHGVQQLVQDCKIIIAPDPQRKYLVGQSPYGLMIEVGPIANSVINAETIETTQEILEKTLQTLCHLPKSQGAIVAYEEVQDVYYPRDEINQINAYIHSEFQGKDFVNFKGRVAVFRDFSGKEICLDFEEELYPIFINEAAYYPQGLAFTLCRKKMIHFD